MRSWARAFGGAISDIRVCDSYTKLQVLKSKDNVVQPAFTLIKVSVLPRLHTQEPFCHFPLHIAKCLQLIRFDARSESNASISFPYPAHPEV